MFNFKNDFKIMKRLLTLAVILMVCFSTTYAATITPDNNIVAEKFNLEIIQQQYFHQNAQNQLTSSIGEKATEASVYECCQTVTATLTDGEGNFASASSTFCSVISCDMASSLASTMALIEASKMLAQL
jgi:hypothetical protein